MTLLDNDSLVGAAEEALAVRCWLPAPSPRVLSKVADSRVVEGSKSLHPKR